MLFINAILTEMCQLNPVSQGCYLSAFSVPIGMEANNASRQGLSFPVINH